MLQGTPGIDEESGAPMYLSRMQMYLSRMQALAPWAALGRLAVAVLVAGIVLLGVGNGLVRVGAGLAIAGVALAVAQQIRRRWTSRAPEAERRATTILFGAGQRDELTRSLKVEVDQVVRNLKSFDAKFLGTTVMAMLHEYEQSRESSDRQAALLNVVMLMEKLKRTSPLAHSPQGCDRHRRRRGRRSRRCGQRRQRVPSVMTYCCHRRML